MINLRDSLHPYSTPPEEARAYATACRINQKEPKPSLQRKLEEIPDLRERIIFLEQQNYFEAGYDLSDSDNLGYRFKKEGSLVILYPNGKIQISIEKSQDILVKDVLRFPKNSITEP